MIDGINTGYLPLDADELSERLGMALNSRRVCHNCNGLIFNFVELVDTDTGELRNMCKLRGSVHKYANRGAHNADAFRMSDLYRVFIQLEQDYGIKPDITPLLNVEFGVNLKLAHSPQQVIKAARLYKGFQFVPMSNIGVEYKADAFRIKIYDKEKQCKLHEFENVLRIEVKTEQNYLKKRGVHVPMLGDLLSTDAWQHFETILLDIVENITFAEDIPLDGLTKKESDLLELFTGDGWQALDKFKRYRERKKFQTLIGRLPITGIKEHLKSLIKSECEQLRDIEFRYRDGKLPTANIREKINERYKTTCNKDREIATETANFRGMSKGQNRYQDGTWITSVSVAKVLTTDTMPSIDKERCMSSAKISDMKIGEAKNRGKPPDILGIDGS
mgnify:CR=1 FL=1